MYSIQSERIQFVHAKEEQIDEKERKKNNAFTHNDEPKHDDDVEEKNCMHSYSHSIMMVDAQQQQRPLVLFRQAKTLPNILIRNMGTKVRPCFSFYSIVCSAHISFTFFASLFFLLLSNKFYISFHVCLTFFYRFFPRCSFIF